MPAEELSQYRAQQGFVARICALYEAAGTGPCDYSQLVDLLQQVGRVSGGVGGSEGGRGEGGDVVTPLLPDVAMPLLPAASADPLRPGSAPPRRAAPQMQKCGQPPQEIVDELAPGMQARCAALCCAVLCLHAVLCLQCCTWTAADHQLLGHAARPRRPPPALQFGPDGLPSFGPGEEGLPPELKDCVIQ